MLTQQDVGSMLAQYIKELVAARLEPQQKQLADVIQKVREKVEPGPAVVPAKVNGEGKRSRGRPPGKTVGRKRAMPLAVAKDKGGRPGGDYKIPKSQWARLAKRLANGESGIKLGKEYGVTPQTVYNTVNRLEQ